MDNEEQILMESLEKDTWESTKNIEGWKTLLSKTATNTLSLFPKTEVLEKSPLIKDHRMYIRITKNDLDRIKLKAVEEGLPYQTLVTSIIHKYVTGKLMEKQAYPKALPPGNGRPQKIRN